jgi:hypothetical protein
MNRVFVEYQKHFGEALKLGRHLLEQLTAKSV